MSLITDTVQSNLPFRRKTTPSGWISFNAVCCHHNGTGADTRQRGGIIINGEGVSYHCFNCQFKASWQPGRTISIKFKKLLQWLGVSDDLITKCTLDALKLKEDGTGSDYVSQLPVFLDKALPRGARPITEYLDDPPSELVPVLEYLQSRNLYLEDYTFCWTDEEGFNNRVIVPYFYQGRIVGYTGRKITEGKPKYISEQQPGYVFNVDRQFDDRKFVIVCEGQFDAISIDGVAIMGSELSEPQRLIIDQIKKQIVVVPDKDHEGPKIVEQAIEFGWAVSFPDWGSYKDANECVQHHGRLYTLDRIIKGIQFTELKIRLKAKTWFKENNDDEMAA